MYEEFYDLYLFAKQEVLDTARCKPLVLSRLKSAEEEDQEYCLLWLQLIMKSDAYANVIRRLKDLPDNMLEYYKVNDMMNFPEVKYRREALKDLRQLWVDTIPDLVRRKDVAPKQKETPDYSRDCNSDATVSS